MDTEAALVLVAVITALPAVIHEVHLFRVGRRVEEVKNEVRTFNESSTGKLLTDEETRRVEDIPHDDRTAKEQRHLDDADPPDPAQGPRR